MLQRAQHLAELFSVNAEITGNDSHICIGEVDIFRVGDMFVLQTEEEDDFSAHFDALFIHAVMIHFQTAPTQKKAI